MTTSANDWGPAKQVASRFFHTFGHLGKWPFGSGGPRAEGLWNGKVVNASTPANLLHEVAHFQLAPNWRRFKIGYGLGMEPEGWSRAPYLVSDGRAAREEALASVLGILWQAHLDYEDWRETACSHDWLKRPDQVENVAEFLRFTEWAAPKLAQLGVITPDGTPVPVFAKPWRTTADLFSDADDL